MVLDEAQIVIAATISLADLLPIRPHLPHDHHLSQTDRQVAAKPMRIIEKALVRMKGLKKWFVKITPGKAQAAVKKLAELAA